MLPRYLILLSILFLSFPRHCPFLSRTSSSSFHTTLLFPLKTSNRSGKCLLTLLNNDPKSSIGILKCVASELNDFSSLKVTILLVFFERNCSPVRSVSTFKCKRLESISKAWLITGRQCGSWGSRGRFLMIVFVFSEVGVRFGCSCKSTKALKR